MAAADLTNVSIGDTVPEAERRFIVSFVDPDVVFFVNARGDGNAWTCTKKGLRGDGDTPVSAYNNFLEVVKNLWDTDRTSNMLKSVRYLMADDSPVRREFDSFVKAVKEKRAIDFP